MNDSQRKDTPADMPLEQRLQDGAWKEIASRATLGYAHDLNNTLTGILGVAETPLETAPGHLSAEHLDQLKRSARQAAQLVEAIGALHRLKAGHRDHHDLNALVSRSTELIKRAVPRGIELQVQLCATLLPVHVDAQPLLHAVANLVFNAASTMMDRGVVRMSTSLVETASPATRWFCGSPPPRRCAALTVEDEGPGIPSEIVERLFAPLAAWESEGTQWLELLQVRRLAESCGGGIEIAPGRKGSAIHLLIPLVDLDAH